MGHINPTVVSIQHYRDGGEHKTAKAKPLKMTSIGEKAVYYSATAFMRPADTVASKVRCAAFEQACVQPTAQTPTRFGHQMALLLICL